MVTSTSGFDQLPPVVQLLFREPLPASDWNKYLKRLLPELRRQAMWTMENEKLVYPEMTGPGLGLAINPSAGLDPFSAHGKCSVPACRLLNADQIARTVGLYADVALIGDPFTDQVLLTDRWTQTKTLRFFGNMLVFHRLRPLFEAGVFRFVSNFGAFCEYHTKEFRSQVKAVTDELLTEVASVLSFERNGDTIVIQASDFFGFPLYFTVPLNAKHKRQVARAADLAAFGRILYAPVLQDEVHETLFKMRRASPLQAVTFSNSRVSVMAVRRFDNSYLTKPDIEVWEASRSANLPWVSNLSTSQIIALRESAKDALPRFRARMARALTNPTPGDAAKVVHDLREEAAEVRAELNALDTKGEGRFRTIAGLLGMTVSVYGFAGEFLEAGAALTGLLTLFGLLHRAGHKERSDLAKVTSS